MPPCQPLDLLTVLTGCPIGRGGDLRFERFDSDAMKMITTGDTVVEVFMRRRGSGSPWTVFATVASMPSRPIRWRADPGERSGGVLESVRLTSLEWNGEGGPPVRLDVLARSRPDTCTLRRDVYLAASRVGGIRRDRCRPVESVASAASRLTPASPTARLPDHHQRPEPVNVTVIEWYG